MADIEIYLKNIKKIPFSIRILIALFKALDIADDILFFGKPKSFREVMYPEFPKILHNLEKQKSRRELQKLVDYLLQKRYLKRAQRNKQAIILTPNGFKHLALFFKKHTEQKIRQDKKWQMVSFDIPEDFRERRNKFRNDLKRLGFQQFQKSIWVSPYDVFKEAKKIARQYKLEEYVRYFLLEEKDLF